MANYLIKQGQKWSVKVAIPANVEHVFGKRVFKQSLNTTDKTVAIARSAPLIAQFKDAIEDARGNPSQHLDDYLEDTKRYLKDAKGSPDIDPASIDSVQDEVLAKLVKSRGAQHQEQLSGEAETAVIAAYKTVTGQRTLFSDPLDEYIAHRKVEPKTEAKDRHAITKFAAQVATVEDVDKQAVRGFVKALSEEDGLKNRTIKDNLSTLRVY